MEEIILKISKTKLDDCCILCIDKKNLRNNSIKVWLTYLNMEAIFMNTENRKANERNKLIYQFTYKLNLKNPNNKNIN